MTEPLTSADTDLRDFPYMPLDVVRLRDSETSVLNSGEEFRAAVLLWCAAWHQVPAASLPNDDRLLANLAGFGRDLEGWKNIREGALRGFILCTDDRLYHPVIAEKAQEATQKKWSQRKRTEAATNARRSKDENRNDDRNDLRDDGRNVVQGKGREGKREEGKKKEFRRVAKATAPTENHFEEFWKSYPRRNGDNPRKSALKAFDVAVRAGANPKDIIAGVKLAAARNADNIGTKFIPQAVKWLRDERWKDHLAQAEKFAGALELDWPRLVSLFKNGCPWPSNLGPQPDTSGCRAPQNILREFGYLPNDDPPRLTLASG